MELPQAWSTVFYVASSGRVPVREWVEGQNREVQERVVALLQVLRDQGGRLGMPHAKHLRGRIWELRIRAGRAAYRILYATVSERRILVLHGFHKTTQETPPRELSLAEDRLADFLRRDIEGVRGRKDRRGGDGRG
jgi:phage-related protein